MTAKALGRRVFFGAGLAPPLGACTSASDPFAGLFGNRKTVTLSPRGDRMARWLQNAGRDTMMAPEAFAVMGITNGGRDIPVKQIGDDDREVRYVISLVNIRQIHEFVLHRRQGDVLTFHHCDTRFARLSSVRYPRNGKPLFIADTALAENDFQQQLGFWFNRMPGR